MRKKYLLTAISVSIALVLWLTRSFMHYYGYGEETFEVIPSDLNELRMRCLIVVLIIAVGVTADYRNGHEKADVYKSMLSASNHIPRNHIQSMLIFREEALKSKDFDKDVLNDSDQMIDKTVAQIRNLENIQSPGKPDIEDRYLLPVQPIDAQRRSRDATQWYPGKHSRITFHSIRSTVVEL